MRLYKTKDAHGVVTRTSLLRRGNTRRRIRAAEAAGDLIRIDRCRYAWPDTPEAVVRAARMGATITCRTALEGYGIWTLPGSQLHLRRERYERRTRPLDDDMTICGAVTGIGDVLVDDLPTALEQLHDEHGREETVVAIDSMLRKFGPSRGRRLVPQRLRHLLEWADPRCESALESIIRQRLRAAGIRCELQVRIKGVGRVDHLIGDRLIVEGDGLEHHATPEGMANDRRRDRRAQLRGYVVVRITWRMLREEWPEILADIRALMAQDRHRSARHRRRRESRHRRSPAQSRIRR